MENLYSKNAIGKISYSPQRELEEIRYHHIRINDDVKSANEIINIRNRETGASVFTKTDSHIISRPYLFITFVWGETIKHVFNSNDELENYVSKHGLQKLINSKSFFNPYQR